MFIFFKKEIIISFLKSAKLKVQIVKDEDEPDNRRYKRNYRNEQREQELDEVAPIEDFVSPFQTLITDLNKDETLNKSIENLKRKINALRSDKSEGNKKKALKEESGESVDEDETDDDEIEIDESGINTYAQEVLCKDNLETEEKAALDPFTIHFEKNMEAKDVEKIKQNLQDRSVLNSMEDSFEVTNLILHYLFLLNIRQKNSFSYHISERLSIHQSWIRQKLI